MAGWVSNTGSAEWFKVHGSKFKIIWAGFYRMYYHNCFWTMNREL